MRIEDERQNSVIVHSIYPIFNSEGAVDRLAVYAKDVTETRRSESALRDSEARFRLFVEAANEGVWSMDGEFRTTFVNRKMAEMLGYNPEEMLGRTVDSFMFEEDSLDHEARMAKRQLGRNDSYERRFRRKDGDEVWTLVSATAMVGKNMEFQGSFAMFTDITERKRSEKALRSSEAQKYAILNGISANISFLNDKLEILWVNRTAAESLGLLPEDMIGATCYSLWADPERPCAKCPAIKAFQTRRSQKAILTTPDGRILDERAEAVLDNSGNLIGVVQLAQDITEYKRLTDKGKLLSTAIEQAWESVVITDSTGTIQYVNPAAEAASGYRSDELIGKGVAIFDSGKQDKNFYKELWETINAGNVWSGRFINRRKDGTIYHEDATISPVYDKSGNLTNFVSVKRDMTKQVELQQQLRQARISQKLNLYHLRY